MKRKLWAYTDTKYEALKKKRKLAREGVKNLTIKSEYGGYSVQGSSSKMPMKKMMVKKKPRTRYAYGLDKWQQNM